MQGMELSIADAEKIVETLSGDFSGSARQWGKRTDSERIAIGVIVLSRTLSGASLRQLEKEFDIPYTTLHRYKETALSTIALPTVDAARTEEIERLDKIVSILWPEVENGNKDAIASYMKVSERRAKILGLDKPIQVEAVIAEVTPAELELKQMLDGESNQNQTIKGELVDEGEKEWPI